ncbi:MAG: AsmA family protein [Methyloceanibacter sp.]|uniref:AsmA family protein n=1 Tax=Methyloceanibacter sp. TaxID=1965321 RepID=UPI003D9B3D54
MNSLLLSLTALLILVLSALFAAPLFIDWNDYRHVFETQATKLLGREVKVDGKVHLVLLPAPELKFDEVKVADEAGRLELPFLEARSIEAWLNIGALLTGTLEARKIVIVDPILRLDVKADGTGNWRDVGRPGVALPFAPKEVMLDSVSVSGGRIEIAKAGIEQLILNDVGGELSAASLAGPYKVSAAYDFGNRRQELRFSTSQSDEAGLFRIKAALRDPELLTSYAFDGAVSGLGTGPSYDGTVTMRIANAAADAPSPVEVVEPVEEANGEQLSPSPKPADDPSFVELKGPLKATPDRAELPEFDLTIHAKGRPQILKGNLALDLGETFKAEGALSARFIDVDLLFGTPNAEHRPSPAAILYLVAEEALAKAAEIGQGTFTVTIEQASLGGDLVSGLNFDLAARDGVMTIERLASTLPGDSRIEVSGQLAQGAIGPVFTGPVKLEGTGLRALTRWAAGDRDMSGQASVGDFAVQANATIGDGELKLADAIGEVSDTTFRGALSYRGGDRSLIELTLDSDRLDLREMMGEGPAWNAWLPASETETDSADAAPSLLAQFRGHDARVTLNVGELLLPDIPAGRLDARFALVADTLDVERLEFAATDELTLTGKGRIESVSEAPSGGVDFALKAATTGGLRAVSGLFGLSEDVSKSKHLSALAPLDVQGGLVAVREGDTTKASLELAGQAGGSQIKLTARATGKPDRLAEAEIDLGGSVTGERPEALLVLLFPDLPQDRIAKAGGRQGTLSVKLAGVPKTGVTAKAALETAAMQLAFEGSGALPDSGLALTGKASIATQDASLVLPMAGLDAPPSATNIPLTLTADVVKQGDSLTFAPIKATIDGEALEGSAKFLLGGDKTRFTLQANTTTVSLPSLLGVLVAWQRSPSSEEMLGALAAHTSEVWPSRGFSLGAIETSEGDITLQAKTLSLGAPFQVADATLAARVDKEGLTVTDLKGRLFGGAFAASGLLAPRGAGAELQAQAEIKGGKLEDLSKSMAGKGLAKGPFDLALTVQGEGLSPPGLVAGLSGEGTLALGAGSVQALNPEPLRRVAATAAKRIKANKEQIAAEARAVREKVTTGLYKYAPTQFPFEVKNGTLRFTPTMLAGAGAETKVNAYVELASLKLDSEWEISLVGKNKNVPAVSIVFAGTLSDAGQIAPAIDTAAIEAYLTMRRMQEDVERLETLDVTGRTPAPPSEPEPVEETPQADEAIHIPIPDAKPAEIAKPAAPAAPPKIMPMPDEIASPAPPASPSQTMPMPDETAAPVLPVPSADTASPADVPTLEDQATSVIEDQTTPTTAEVPAVDAPVVRSSPRRSPKREAPDAWKKGIGIFGG